MSGKDGVEIKLDSSELERQLKELGGKVSAKDTMKALRKGAEPMLAEARRLAPVRTGLLLRSLKIRQRTIKGEPYCFVGINKETAATGTDEHGGKVEPWRYAHLVEFGTDGGKRGKRAFLRPAFDAKKDTAIERVRAALAQLIASLKAK